MGQVRRVLLHPIDSRAVVRSTNLVGTGLVHFQESLGIESSRTSLQAKRWMTAAVEMRDQVIETGSDGVDAAGRLGDRALDGARSVAGKVSKRVAEARRQRDPPAAGSV